MRNEFLAFLHKRYSNGMSKIIGAIIIVLLVAGGAYWYMQQSPASSDAVVETQSESKVGFTWNITEMDERADNPGVPRTNVALTSGGKTYQVGEFDGSCSEIDGTSWTLVEGEKTGVICWWAGGGSEVGVFEEGGKLVVKVGVLEEGTAEIPGSRGSFQTFVTIE